MKYIRTKTYIYEKPDDKYIENNQVLHFANRPTEEEKIGFLSYIEYEDILKEADTIEELCDYCIYRNCEEELIIRKLPLSSSLKSIMRSIESGLIHDEIKLAILTDKGLIYAAKLNEKGEFELL